MIRVKKDAQGFTLVELVIVVVIISIVSTIGFLSYTSYLVDSRDANRVYNLTKTVENFQRYSSANDLPIPDNAVSITNSGYTIAYQGKLGKNVFESMDMDEILDPKDKTYYSYFLAEDRKGFQFIAYMEKDREDVSFLTNSYADYSDRYIRIFGIGLGILADANTQVPLEDLSIPGNTIDISNVGVSYQLNSYLSEDEYVVNNTGALASLEDISDGRGKGWRVEGNDFVCVDSNDDGRCPAGTTNPNYISPSDEPCFNPENVGIVGSSGVCENLLIVDRTLLDTVVSSGGVLIGGINYTLDLPNGVFVGQVTDFSSLFDGNTTFNDNISYWDTRNAETFRLMFDDAELFNQDISEWDTSNSLSLVGMFRGAHSFNQDISNWDTSKVTEIGSIFAGAHVFNQPIGKWDIDGLIGNSGLSYAFAEAYAFNQPLDNWNVQGALSFISLFRNAIQFNQDISNWDTSTVTNMTRVFGGATSFDQDLSGWCVTNFVSEPSLFDDSTTAWNKMDRQPIWGTCP